ncbi:MAG: hypothetical protein M0C28_44195 [Candidatus Moduliflexus flocculans]|nr:hypothetical protein [Candidatus Moduliflexus flocculans]
MKSYTFILLRIPMYQPESDVPYNTVPLGIMILGNKIVTVCRYDSDIFKPLTNGKYRYLKTGKRYRLALYIFLETASRYLNSPARDQPRHRSRGRPAAKIHPQPRSAGTAQVPKDASPTSPPPCAPTR